MFNTSYLLLLLIVFRFFWIPNLYCFEYLNLIELIMKLKHVFLGFFMGFVLISNAQSSSKEVLFTIDDKPFYQLEGTITKDVSILKADARSDEDVTPPLAQSIQLSFRDSSKNRCRIIQTAILTTPTPIDYAP